MGTRKLRLLMSKYGFSIAIILIELFVVFAVILYMSQIAPFVWVTLVFLVSVATVLAIVNRSMSPESKVTWLIVTFVPVFGPLLYIMFGERRLSKRNSNNCRNFVLLHLMKSESIVFIRSYKKLINLPTVLSMPCYIWIVMQRFMTIQTHNSLLMGKKCGNRCWRI